VEAVFNADATTPQSSTLTAGHLHGDGKQTAFVFYIAS
jgi:hypothetical protein